MGNRCGRNVRPDAARIFDGAAIDTPESATRRGANAQRRRRRISPALAKRFDRLEPRTGNGGTVAKAKRSGKRVSDLIASETAQVCKDPDAQTADEIYQACLVAGLGLSETSITRRLRRGIDDGTIKTVKVLRKNIRGVMRPVDAYLLVG